MCKVPMEMHLGRWRGIEDAADALIGDGKALKGDKGDKGRRGGIKRRQRSVK